MTNYNNTTEAKAGSWTVTSTVNSLSCTNSPRINGQLELVANTVSHRKGRLLLNSWHKDIRSSPYDCLVARDLLCPSGSIQEVQSRAKERWNGKLKDGSASLAVTLAQYGKTRDMVGQRLQQARGLYDRDLRASYSSISKIAKNLRQDARRNGVSPASQLASSTGSKYLEGTFGWGPLISDAVALVGSVFEKGIPPLKLTAQNTRSGSYVYYDGWFGKLAFDYRVTAKCNGYAAVPNLNANLLERSGATDVASAAWDVIPWSWVAGMFVNVNAMLSDMRGFPAIALTNTCTTTTIRSIMSETYKSFETPGQMRSFISDKHRTLGLPTVGFRFKRPDMSLGLAAIGVSLMAQRWSAYNRDLTRLATYGPRSGIPGLL